ncbi:hypothetical protein NP493_1215g00002 [Ridgeia piscesae]|uniref:Large ribosomal subunit protein mL43 n=1 Tax=Ridgeia piscesae TaxID=27915 RepID=A0AAD9NHV4_RIDPI|nr:hypothetical protein NP493_1215g00002 [Ridgeia piscesae]
MSHATIPSGFVKSALQNGAGRYVCQLQRLTLVFCKSSGGSRGLRDFVEKHLLEFTQKNPGVVVYLQPRRHRPPKLVAEYLNGRREEIPVATHNDETICQWVNHLRTHSGNETVRLRKTWHTDTPSIQGPWTPFTNKDTRLNVTQLPSEELSRFQPTEPSATEKLLRLAEQLRAKDAVKGGGETGTPV